MPGSKEKTLIHELLRKIEERFGIPRDLFEGYCIYERRKGEFWISSRFGCGLDDSFVARRGLKFAQVFSKGGFRLSTSAIQLFGGYATRCVVELEEDEREAYIRGQDLPDRWGAPPGQIIVRYRGIPLGSAVVVEGRLKNQVPTARRVRG